MTDANPFAGLNDDQLRIVHSAAESFEQSLRKGEAARIEPFLASVEQDLKPALLDELLAIKLEWRFDRGETPEESEYAPRFPQMLNVIRSVFQYQQRAISSGSGRSESGSDSGGKARRGVADSPTPGMVIDGRYTITEPIGEGGMGSVFLAEQHEPVTRQVAIKFIKGGMDSKAVLARFDVERKTLAMMDHPGIASVYDGGQTEDGLPYFVMELVRGVSITRYCDENRVDVRERLNLFVAICQAVQHAHLKGIIHRDLKPGNILVTHVDGRAVPKVIDFGVAKAIDHKLTDGSLAASTAMIIGTPAYMSPEQADPLSKDIDTRTDVYALGIVLYELLVGSPPHETGSLPRGAILEALRMIREVDSPRPSTKVRSSISLPEIAASRNIDPDKLAPLLRGELDWIAMKALDKDRDRRYETVSGLARDVERYLAGEVVEARPPSTIYRIQKFARRNKGQVIAAGLLLLTMTAGIIGTTLGLLEAKKHEQTAKNELIAKEQARENEATERKYAEAVADFVVRDILALTSLEGRLENDEGKSGLNKDSTLRELLDRAAEKLKTRTDLEPRTKARLLTIIGESYVNLGAFPNAIETFEQSIPIYAELVGSDHLDTLTEQGLLVLAFSENGQDDLALPLAQEVLAWKITLLGPDHTEVLKSKRMLAKLLRKAGDHAKAVKMLEETLAGLTSLHGPHHHDVLTNMYDLALAMNSAEQPEKAVPLLENALALQKEHLGENHPDTHATAEKLGELYTKAGEFKKAQPLNERGVTWAKENYGPEHPTTIYAMARLAGLYRSQRQLDQLIPLSEQLLEVTRKAFGAEHPNVANAASDLATTYRVAGDHEKALPLFEEALALRTTGLGANHPLILSSKANVAACLSSMGQTEKSQLLNEECLKLAMEIHGEDHSTTITIKQNLAAGYWKAKQLDRSVPLFEEVLAYWVAKSGRTHPSSLMAMANLGVNYRDAGRLDEALSLLEEVYRAVPEAPSLSFIGTEYMDALLRAGKSEQGLQLLPALVEDARKTNPADSLKLATPLATLGMVLLRSNELTEAEPLLRESATIRQQQEPNKWRTFDTVGMLGESLLRQQKTTDAEPLLVAAIEGMELHAADGPKEANDRRCKLIDELAESLKAQNRPDDAAIWEARKNVKPADGEPK